ncbi:amidohydrolase [Actinoalloteichus sp. AHMU CJ021]|uniref:Peptidase M20 domain-containing protein 2 n=2 Tax=Actinoalloteichus cyanogriseus TaxID=2893586 RepID=A0ABT1JM97_ACTCY|nr:M20 family metallopeptidase [Actinoalloteichus caeruleus]AUS79352.1 amidohydrolase [Actinoalloteichus sp. AHMU CJ021]MCP2333642.1 amidohydrolase [Actinoalloteichus caeruleus DSM 43889]
MDTGHRSSLRSRCARAVRAHAPALVGLSHSIHAEPELAFAEHESVRKITTVLADEGFEVRGPVAGLDTAFTASFGHGDLVVGLCAEYDALPEVGHACGHNVIAAAAVGAALGLRDVADELGITVLVIGTPAEEVGGGKVLMLERGVFDPVALALMVHPGPEETVTRPSRAIADLEVRYTGRESHASSAPERGINAADALTVAQVAIGLARQHLEPGQQVHGIVTHGGAAPNIVPARTSAVFNLRAPEVESLARLSGRIEDCLRAGAVATGAGYETSEISPVYAELRPDDWLAEAYREAVVDLGRAPLSPAEERSRVSGSTDMGNVTHVVPGIHPTLALDCGDAVNHQPEFAAACVSPSADQAVLDGAVAMAWTAVAAATDSEQRTRLLADVAGRAAASRKVAATGGAA